MKVFDSKLDTDWLGHSFSVDKRTNRIAMSKGSSISRHFNKNSNNYIIKLYGKRRTGRGELFVEVLSGKERIMLKKLKLKTSASESTIKFSCDITNRDLLLNIYRDKTSVGTIELDRVIISDDNSFENKLIRARKNNQLSEREGAELDYKEEVMGLVKIFGKRRIAFVVPYGIYGGAEVYIKNILENINKDIFSCSVLMLRKNIIKHMVEEKSIKWEYLPTEEMLSSHLLANSYDYLVYYNSRALYSRLSALASSGEIKSDLYEIYHSNFKWSDSLSSVNSRSDYVSGIFAISNNLANNINFSGFRKTLPVGIDIAKFSKGEKLHSFRDVFKNNNKIIGVVSRLSVEKSVNYVVNLAKNMKYFNFVVLGDGPQRKSLLEAASGVDNVHFHGFVRDTHKYYNEFDAFICPSRCDEGTPISILEAMSSEVPVFTMMSGEISSIISDGVTGFQICGDVHADVEKIRKTMLNNTLCNKARKAAREFVEENHNIVKISDKFSASILSSQNTYSPIHEDRQGDILPGTYI